MIGAKPPPVVIAYGMGESLETAVITVVGRFAPMLQLTLRTVLSATLNLGTPFVMRRLMGTTKSAKPETRKCKDAVYVPGAKVSATLVEEKRRLLGVDPLKASDVSQIGKLVVSRLKNGAAEALDVIATSTFAAVPAPFT